MKRQGKIAKYWDHIQGDKNAHCHESRTREFHEIFAKHRSKKILDIACGSGAFLIGLARMGYECTGSDIDEDMLAAAREKAGSAGVQIDFKPDDMINSKIKGPFDAVTCFQALSLLKSKQEIETAVRSVAHSLKPGGIFIFDVLSRDGMDFTGAAALPPFIDVCGEWEKEKQDIKIVRINKMSIGQSSREWDSIYFFSENGNVSIEVRNERIHVYALAEIKQILAGAGFETGSVVCREAKGIRSKNMLIHSYLEGSRKGRMDL